ncbi:MAG: 2-oxoglutarate and iron-dependent oxygenase domain-containing protein [Humibacillus sp.]
MAATGHVPVIDVGPWFTGSDADRAEVAAAVDEALSSVGFMLITGHGVPSDVAAQVRSHARAFFALPEETKRAYAVTIAGRGWLPPGVEANAFSEGTQTPPDMKETFAVGAHEKTGDAAVDGYWFPDNVWPGEVPGLQVVLEDYLERMRVLADELLRICGAALGRVDLFTDHTAHSTFTLNLNWYPPLRHVGDVAEGQFRIGPHTDFGTVTILDREPGAGGLQVWTEEDGWEDAPWEPGALTINTGDLLERWSGGRWTSNRHRVLPPQQAHPDEDLVSLVYFYEADHDTEVVPLPPPLGRVAGLEPVVSGAFIRQRLDAITVG